MQNTNQIIYLSPEEIYPHPNNPRKDLGDLTELSDSIRFVGVLQNLTVVPGRILEDGTREESGYTVIIGHRRHAAAKLAGVEKLPCIIADMDERQQAATMLLENMQRNDLTIFEQAHGFQMMLDLGETQQSIAEKTGLSPATVSRRLKLLVLDKNKLQKAEERGGTLEDYIKASEIKNEKARNRVTDAIGTNNFHWEYRSAMQKQVFKEKMPVIKKEMKKLGATQESGLYYWDSRYEQILRIDIKDYEEGVFEKAARKLKGEKALLWTASAEKTVCLVKKKPKTKKEAPKKSAQEKRADELRERLAEVTAKAYESRKEFLREFSAAKKYRQEINAWLWEYALNRLTDSGFSRSFDLLCEKIGEEKEKYMYACDKEKLLKYAKEEESNAPAVIMGALCGDLADNGYYNRNYGENAPQHRENEALDFIYKHLQNIGYEMSDEEKALQDGTHELFHSGAGEK